MKNIRDKDPGNERIAIIYCSLDDFPIGSELESIPDSEEAEISVSVKEALESAGYAADILKIHPGRLESLLEYDWIFNLAESIVGHDDLLLQIARGMEFRGLRFTGSGSTALWNCQVKSRTKEILRQHGLPTPNYVLIEPGEPIHADLNFPLFVKPLQLDSHIGVAGDSIVQNRSELAAKVKKIHRRYQQPALVEEYIEGRDISAALIGNGADLQLLPLYEVVFLPGFIGPKVLTYEATWVENSIAYANNIGVCPASLNDPLRDLMQSMARDSYNALGCWDYARIDFRLEGDKPLILEVNPNPCLYPVIAGFIVACRVAGMDYPTTILKILESSMRRYEKSGAA